MPPNLWPPPGRVPPPLSRLLYGTKKEKVDFSLFLYKYSIQACQKKKNSFKKMSGMMNIFKLSPLSVS